MRKHMKDEHAPEALAKTMTDLLQEQRRTQWTWKVRITTGKDKNSTGKAITRITRRYS
jgi:hypothetical protein